MNLQNFHYDVAVVGGGPSGLAAALSAARHGAKVIILERNGYLGGNAVTGLPFLGFLDKQGRQVVGGIAQEMIDSLIEIGRCAGHNRCPLHNSVTVLDPEYFKIIAMDKCREAGIDILFHCELVDVNVVNRQMTQVSVMGKGMRIDITASVFIDATGDGDAAFLAGCSFEKGQKETGLMQPPTLMFSLCGYNEEEFFHYLEQHPEDLQPAESMQVSQGYDVPYFRSHRSYVFLGLRNRLKVLNEEGCNPLNRDTLIYINSMNLGQIYVNTTRIYRCDGSDPHDLTRGEIEGMKQITQLVELLKDKIPGFQNCYISSINPSLGIRETRRFSGKKRLAIDDVVRGHIPEDTIALGSYKVDIHSSVNDSTILRDLEGPYGIPLGCLISDEIDGLLLSGRCISMDAPSLGSVRIMPTCMALGEAAGVCASLSVDQGILPAQVPVDDVVALLKEDQAILSI
ncbi:FAD-dependent oxidoreductase [Novisyntrophococcus fermenticellae]|uniref:FAD-dependent oxidoreductase n=1 Tax=Novisyntrophococcus fermenticellae TaxID=2068655 RepID=UPI001E51A05E|nr:FAD-dependent oxidoreductase [Novisyntrophococcus fermenticellae]